MRLFLSSYRAQGHEADLVKLFGKDSKVAVINNAKDGKIPEERQQKTNEVMKFLKDAGLKPTEIDLRSYFDDNSGLAKELSKYSSIWVLMANNSAL